MSRPNKPSWPGLIWLDPSIHMTTSECWTARVYIMTTPTIRHGFNNARRLTNHAYS